MYNILCFQIYSLQIAIKMLVVVSDKYFIVLLAPFAISFLLSNLFT